MYSDDSMVCCLLPSSCNMFDRTPGVIFMDSMWYLNTMAITFTVIFVIISISRIVDKIVKVSLELLFSRNIDSVSCKFKMMGQLMIILGNCPSVLIYRIFVAPCLCVHFFKTVITIKIIICVCVMYTYTNKTF